MEQIKSFIHQMRETRDCTCRISRLLGIVQEIAEETKNKKESGLNFVEKLLKKAFVLGLKFNTCMAPPRNPIHINKDSRQSGPTQMQVHSSYTIHIGAFMSCIWLTQIKARGATSLCYLTSSLNTLYYLHYDLILYVPNLNS